MKLTKATRKQISVGSILSTEHTAYEVIGIFENSGRYRNGINITVRITKWYEDKLYMVGSTLYYEPLSSFYGCNIDKV